jgi:hypothetical protein
MANTFGALHVAHLGGPPKGCGGDLSRTNLFYLDQRIGSFWENLKHFFRSTLSFFYFSDILILLAFRGG